MSIFECKHLSFVCTKFLFNVLPLKASVQFFSGCCHWSSRNDLALIIPRYALCNMSKAHKPKLKGESTNEINDAKFFCKDDSTTFLNRSNTSKGAKKSKKLASVKNQDKRDVKAKNSHKKKKTKKPFDPTSGITHSLSKLEIGSNNVSQSKRINDRRQVRAYSTQSAGPTHPGRTEHNALKEVVKYISSGAAKNIVVMCGAGISTASGIPDFRTPGTGLYDNLQRYKIPYPTAVFDSGYFQTNPRPFFELARELYPTGKYRPNSAHYFIRALHDKGLLLRLYTQNIDGLERIAGIPPSKLVEAHGTFSTASCVRCGKKCNGDDIKAKIFKGTIPRCQQTPLCYGVVKPDIVFFGDDLPQRFYYYLRDFPVCDLLIVMGTSLEVEPFASLVDSTRYNVPRLLLNRERVGPFVKRTRGRPKDYAITGELPDTVARLVKHLEWKEFVRELTAANEQDAALVESGKSTDPADGRTDSGVSSASSISSKDSEDGSGGVVGGVRAGVNIPPPVDSNVKRYFTTLRSTPLPKPNSRTRPLDVHASGEPPGVGKAMSTSTSTAVTNVSYYDFIRTNASASASKKPQPSPTKPPQQVKSPGAEVPAIFSIAPAPTIQYAQAVKGKKRISPLAPRRGITLNRKLSTVSLPNLAHGTDGSGQSESSSSDGGSSSGSSNDS